MTTLRTKIVAAAAFSVLAAAGAADAAPIRVDFSGNQTGGTINLAGPAAITGFFVYNDAAPNTANSADAYTANSLTEGAFTVSQGGGFVCGGSISGGVNLIDVRNDVATNVGPRDAISAAMTSPLGCLSAVTTTTIRLLLGGPATSWNDISPSADKWADVDLNFFQILLLRSTGEQAFVFNVTSIRAAPVTAVPVPAAAPLMIAGLAALFGGARRRRQAK